MSRAALQKEWRIKKRMLSTTLSEIMRQKALNGPMLGMYEQQASELRADIAAIEAKLKEGADGGN